MDIKLVAVDMDGTFLRQERIINDAGETVGVNQDYDKGLFDEVFAKLKANGGHFVVASGNQYYQLKSFFPEMDHQITYISENGALIMDNHEELFSVEIPKTTVNKVIDVLAQYPEILTCVCGRNDAYVLKGNPNFAGLIKLFYHHLKELDSFNDLNNIDDKILKFALTVPEGKEAEYTDILKSYVGDLIEVVDSGHTCVDLIVPGFNKGTALKLLCNRWGVEPSQCVAFGDGGNDKEMLEFVKYGYAMENARSEIKAIAYEICPSNNDQGVLKTLQKIL